MSPERHEKAKEDRHFRGVLALAGTAAIERTTCDLSCLSAIWDNSLLCLWHLKDSHDTAVKEQGKATRTAWQSAIISCQSQLWLIEYSSCACWFLESASEVKQRENDEKLKSLVHYIVFCWKENVLLRGHPNEKVNQATVSRLSSASDGPQWNCAVWQRKQDLQGIPLLCLSFKPKLMMLLHWGIFIAILIREENKSPKIQNELTDCWRKALALASVGWCKSSIRIKCNNVFVPLSGIHPPPFLPCVSLPAQRDSAN